MRRDLLLKARGDVLDVGAGTGANLAHWPPGVVVTALEPDPHMLRRGKVKGSETPVTWVEGAAESVPYPAESFDTVVFTLVLCSVRDVAQALSEAHRVLRPDGRLIFLEHVASERRRPRRVQDFLNPLWRKLAAGCHLNRETGHSIQAAGFAIERMEREERMRLQPVIYGWARKA